MGRVCEAKKDFEKTLHYYLESSKIAEERGIIRYQILAHLRAGDIYEVFQEYKTAFVNFQTALNLSEESKDLEIKKQSLNSIGLNYHHIGLNDKEMECLQQAMDICKETNDSDTELIRYNIEKSKGFMN